MQIDISPSSLTGQLLVAMPNVDDRVFRRAVVLICAHSTRGAMGIMLNQLLASDRRQGLKTEAQFAEALTPNAYRAGGPAGQDSWQFLHDAQKPLGRQTIRVLRGLNLTPAQKVPAILGPTERPRRVLLALGHCGWAAGQVERELSLNIWLTAPATRDFVFQAPPDRMWGEALGLLGIAASALSGEAGHA